ncbi:glycosyl hydrolase family 28 protein [Paenibacillus donghaensis]|uniref:Glycoside hydrolase n=1 Tax=Paenibacillus donghaensis TaxID=414771 RepID=A0A2Z2K9X4_9BACL|nr:glycosyl hydrolase family 28 protein [Paenibacillus donghaensis]ASA23486.1 hypothetical protein B9T62_23395 [Paenibacillus donghaensis]
MNVIHQLSVYDIPEFTPANKDFTVKVRSKDGPWKTLLCYNVMIDMHQVRNASMVYFDFVGEVEVEIISNAESVSSVAIRPLSYNISYTRQDNTIRFILNSPKNLSLEINGDRYHNLHIFAGEIMKNEPDLQEFGILHIQPGTHSAVDLLNKFTEVDPITGKEPSTLYFAPGLHQVLPQGLLIPSNKKVYLAGGAVVLSALECHEVENVRIWGRGVLHQARIGRDTPHGGIKINFSKNVQVSGITLVNPPYNSIHVGQSSNVMITDFKAFSCTGWSDGIDCLSSSNVEVDGVFMRNSDDCFTVYGSRFAYSGDSRNITLKNSTLWADVAHPTFIGCHGDHEHGGDILEDIHFENIDILEHHEPQQEYLGCMAINAGDENIVRNVRYENIRVEPFENGRLFDLRVFFNAKYNPAPGKRIENIHFKDIVYNGLEEYPSQIIGFNEERMVDGVTLENVVIRGKKVTDVEAGNIFIGEHVGQVIFK